MAVVDFIVIGAMKSGTTTLIDYLHRHPDIYIPPIKEVQYFSRDENYTKGNTWYEAFFVDAEPHQLRGEGSTCYSRWPSFPDAAIRISQYAPHVKLIYIVRDPVERTYSHFRHSILNREFSYKTFREALENESELIESSKYMSQINQYLKYFDAEQFFFIKFEDLANANRQMFSRLFSFLSIKDMDVIAQAPILSNKAGVGQTNAVIVKLIQLGKYIPGFSHLVKHYLSPRQRREILYSIANKVSNSKVGSLLVSGKARQIPPMQAEDRKLILNKCKADTKKFQTFSKLDLNDWIIFNNTTNEFD